LANTTTVNAAIIICPKCGYEQPEGLDCKKCGIVFSKYFTLFPGRKPPVTGEPEEPASEQNIETMPDLRIQLRELQSRFAEVEFEKAERSQLRADLKNLEKQLQDVQWRSSIRLDEFEKLHREPAPEVLELRSQMETVWERLDQLETRAQAPRPGGVASGSDPQLPDILPRIEQEMMELKDQLAVLREQVIELKSAPNNQEIPAPFQADMEAFRNALEELGQFLLLLRKKIEQ
jgi:hypothetical protein